MSNIEMKSSNINWIGDIPNDWEVKRVSNFFKSPKTITSPGRVDVLSLTLGGVIEKDIESNKGLNPESYDTYQIFKKDDLVFKLIDLENYQTSRVGKVWKDGIMSSAYIRLSKNKNTNINYFYYQFFDLYKRAIFNMLGGNGVRSAINRSDLLKLQIVVPPLSQQIAISNYLDHHTTKIDKEISLLEQKVEKLDEYKQALIYETVTKGLDKNVPMKDSGIEWIGDIPNHWEVKRVKEVAKWQTGFTPDTKKSEYYDGNDEWITIGDMDGKYIKESKNKINGSMFPKNWITPANSLLFSFKLSIGQVAFNEKEVFTNEAICSFSPKSNINLKYFYYAAPIFIVKNAKKNIYGADLLNQELISNANVVIFSKNEQEEIAKYLDENCSVIDKKKELINKKIELLKEYKQSLIYEAVTGKFHIGE